MFGDANDAGQLESCRVLGRIKTMSTDTPQQVLPTGADVSDVDFAEVAANLGIQLKQPATEAKPDEETTEPNEAATDESTELDPETDEAQDQNDEEPTTEDEPEDTAGEEPEPKDQDAATDKVAPDKVQKRIDRLTAEKHELREQLDAIKADLEAATATAAAKPPIVTMDPENPLSAFSDVNALEAEIAKAQAVLDWTDDNRDGGTVTVNGEEKFYDADAVKQIRSNAKSLLKAGPKQQEFLSVRAQTLPEAQTFYPDFFKTGTTAHNFLTATLKQYPFITRIPGWELVVGDAFEGQRLRMARVEQMQKRASAGKSSKPAPAKTAASDRIPNTPNPSASPKVSSPGASLRQKAEAALKGRGDRGALEAFMEALV